jgi:hypothetical protein
MSAISLLLQDVAEAMRRLPPDVIVARNQRLKRAMDLSLKQTTLPKELRDKQTPFEHYLLVSGVGWTTAVGADPLGWLGMHVDLVCVQTMAMERMHMVVMCSVVQGSARWVKDHSIVELPKSTSC